MTLDHQFNLLGDKLQSLLKEHKRLQRENEKLHEELKVSRLKEEATDQQVHELQQQIAILKLAAGEMNEQDKKDFEKKLNQYIRDVEKCIAVLSE